MPRRPTFRQRWSNAWKALSGYTPPAYGFSGGTYYGANFNSNSLLQPGAKEDYSREAGDLSLNSIVSIGLNWMTDQASQARLMAYTKGETAGDDETIADDPLITALETPNPGYSVDTLFAASYRDFKVDGNALWIKARNMDGRGQPVNFWYEPWANVTPWRETKSPNIVDWYWINRPTGREKVFPEDVVHFRDGLDPYNVMYGLSRLKRLLRTIVGINRAETYTTSILKWGTLNGVWVPDGDVEVDPKEGIEFQRRIERGGTTENSGRIPVANFPGHFEKIGSGPDELKLDTILDLPIGMICAALGGSAMAFGLPDTNRTYSNYEESISAAWNNGLIPMQKAFASTLYHQLYPDYGDTAGKVLKWDYTGIKALSEDETEKVNRAVLMVGGPVATENEGRKMIGLEPIEGGDELPTQKADRQMQQAADIANAQQDQTGDDDGDPSEDDSADPENPAKGKDAKAIDEDES